MTPLRPFQQEGCRQIYRWGGRALLADEMGLGKTIQALYWLLRTPKHRPAVIVCPASLKYTWQAEAAQHFHMRAEVLEGRLRLRQRRLPGDIVIINYDILKSWLPLLIAADPQTVIFDECHYLQNPSTGWTKAAFKLAFGASSVLGLSGTPITKRPAGFWPILNIIRPDLFPDRGRFLWRYTAPRWTPWGFRFDGAVRKKELGNLLRKECLIRRLKKDILHELPAKIHRFVPFKLNSYKEYTEASDDFLSWLRKKDPLRASRASRNEAQARVGYLLRLAVQLKLEWTVQWLREFAESHPGKKIVGLTMHTAVIEHLHRTFPNSVVVDGKVTGRKRVESVRRFQTDPRVIYFFGNWRAAGTGLTLHASHTFVALDLPWTPGDLLQGQDRVHRIGQKKKVIIYYLILLNTIEEKLMVILQRSTKTLEAILNGQTSKDIDLLGSLLNLMLSK